MKVTRMLLVTVGVASTIQWVCPATISAAGNTTASASNFLHPQAILDPKVDRKLSPAQRARAQRAAALKKKNEMMKFIEGMVTAEQAASGPNGKENAK